MGAGRKVWLLPQSLAWRGGWEAETDLPLENHNRDAIPTRMVQAGGEGPAARLANWEADHVRALPSAQSVALLLLPDSPEPHLLKGHL